MMTKFGVSQNFGQPILPTSMLSRTSTINNNPPFDPKVNMMQYVGADNPIQRLLGNKNLSKSSSNESIQSQASIQSQGVVANSSFSTRTEKVVSVPNKIDDEQLQLENRMLHMVLKHEQVIEELVEENERFRRILVEDLNISPEKFHSKSTSRGSDSLEGRRKQRRR